jgi:hypothetical protein
MINTTLERNIMSETGQATATEASTVGNQVVERTDASRQQTTTISDPRQIAAVVMARMNLINTKKDELTIAMKGLTDFTQQLVQAYATQMQLIEQLSKRIQVLEEKADANRMNGQAVTPGMHSA